MQNIFVLEDDDNIRDAVCYALCASDFAASGFPEPAAFWRAVAENAPDFLILDIMLPDEDGISVLKKLRAAEKTRNIPVILLTAKSAEYDRIKGLDLGADDYVTKPFSVAELLARVKAVLRRTGADTSADCAVGAIILNTEKRTVFSGGAVVPLTYTEFELLHMLMRNAGIVLTRDKLLAQVWGIDADLESRTVDMHIQALRHKLGGAGGQIKTVRSVGYKMEAV